MDISATNSRQCIGVSISHDMLVEGNENVHLMLQLNTSKDYFGNMSIDPSRVEITIEDEDSESTLSTHNLLVNNRSIAYSYCQFCVVVQRYRAGVIIVILEVCSVSSIVCINYTESCLQAFVTIGPSH